MDLKQFAKPYVWQGVTLYFMPYRTLASEITISRLEAIEPHYEFVNLKTGARVNEEPETLKKARLRAEAVNTHVRGDWEKRNLWSITHNTFCLVLPNIVAIEFPPFDSKTPTEVRVFSAFWQEKTGLVAADWETFKTAFGTETVNALWDGFTETRDHTLDADPALQKEPEKDADEDQKKDGN